MQGSISLKTIAFNIASENRTANLTESVTVGYGRKEMTEKYKMWLKFKSSEPREIEVIIFN